MPSCSTSTSALKWTTSTGFGCTTLGTFADQNYATPPAIGGTTPAAGAFSTLSATGNLTTNVTGSTQCLQANTSGVVSGTGSSCGGGGSLTITDGSNTVSGTTQITFSGATVGGSTPNATVTVTGGGSCTTSTWTPVITFGGGSTGLTYTDDLGGYTVCGKQVCAWMSVQIANKGSSSGNAVIGGLPIAADTGSHHYQSFLGWSTASPPFIGFIAQAGGVTSQQIAMFTNSSSPSSLTAANFSNGSQVVSNFCYLTT
jgi:hypothetical protein